MGLQRRIPAEQLVAAVAAQGDGHVLARESGEQVRGQDRCVAERLVEHRGDRRYEIGQHRRLEHELVVVGSEVAGDETGVARFVEGLVGEADREALDLPRRHPRHRAGDRAGVEPAREEHAEGHVADELFADGLAQDTSQLVDEVDRAAGAAVRLAARQVDVPVAGEGRCAGRQRPHERVAWRQLFDPGDNAPRARHELEREVVVERVEVDTPPQLGIDQQGLQLRCKCQLLVAGGVVQRLDADSIAREDDDLPREVEHGEGEHPVQMLDAAFTPLLIGPQEDFGVRSGAEPIPEIGQLPAQLRMVVDLAVEDDPRGGIVIGQRLMATLDVDDREPSHRQADAALDDGPRVVRPAVGERVAHAVEELRRRPLVRCDGDAADPAHRVSERRWRGRRRRTTRWFGAGPPRDRRAVSSRGPERRH